MPDDGHVTNIHSTFLSIASTACHRCRPTLKPELEPSRSSPLPTRAQLSLQASDQSSLLVQPRPSLSYRSRHLRSRDTSRGLAQLACPYSSSTHPEAIFLGSVCNSAAPRSLDILGRACRSPAANAKSPRSLLPWKRQGFPAGAGRDGHHREWRWKRRRRWQWG